MVWHICNSVLCCEINSIRLSKEPFAKVLEWLNSQVNMEEVYSFPFLRLKPSDAPPPPSSPRKLDCVETRMPKNSFETISPTLLPFTPYFLQEALLVGLGGSCFEKTWRSEATTQTHLTQRREDAEAQRLQHLTKSFLFPCSPMIEGEFYRTPMPFLCVLASLRFVVDSFREPRKIPDLSIS